jgi:hypothetical protein
MPHGAISQRKSIFVTKTIFVDNLAVGDDTHSA